MSHPRYQDLEHSLANHGSFGATDLVARATDGKYFVKNIIHLNRMAEALTRDDLYQFGSIVKIRHPNLARVREALIVGSSKTDKEDKMVIISDFIEGGMSLQNSIEIKCKREQDFTTDEVIRIFVQMLLGLKALHDVGLTHGNLKPSNVFLEGPLLSEVNINNNDNNTNNASTSPTANKRTIIKLVGYSFFSFFLSAREQIQLPFYAAPEVCVDIGNEEILYDASQKKYKLKALSSQADVWSVGCIIYELLTFKKPFDNEKYQYLCDQIKSSSFINIELLEVRGIDQELIDLINLMLNKDPSKRPTVDNMLALPLVQKHLAILMNANTTNSKNSSNDNGSLNAKSNNNRNSNEWHDQSFSHEVYKSNYLKKNASPPQNIQSANFDNYTKTSNSKEELENEEEGDNHNTSVITDDDILKVMQVGSPSLTTLGVTDESIRMALEKEKITAFQPKKWAVKRSPTNKTQQPEPERLQQQQQRAKQVKYRTNNAMKIRTNFNQNVKVRNNKNKNIGATAAKNEGERYNNTKTRNNVRKTKKIRSSLSPKTLAVAAASSKRRNNSRKISDNRYNDNNNHRQAQHFTFSSPRHNNNDDNNNGGNKAARMLQRRNSEKIEKQKEHEAMLAEARKQAFKERKELEKKMQGFNNPVKNQFNDNTNTTPPPPPTTTTTNNNSNRYQNNRRSLDGNNSYNHQRNIVTRTNSYEASPKEIQNNRLQRRRSLDNLNRKFNSKQSMQENENAYKEALAKARIEAFEERKALQRKMKGVGGRPSSDGYVNDSRSDSNSSNTNTPHYANSPSYTNTPGSTGGMIPSFDRRQLERKPSVEEIRLNKKKKKMDEEKKYKDALAKARIEAFNERKALEQRHRAAQGRPAVVSQQTKSSIEIAKEIRKNAPFAIDISQEELQQDIIQNKISIEKRRRNKQSTKDAERELYEKQLESARIAAFEERKRLKNKYGRGGGV